MSIPKCLPLSSLQTHSSFFFPEDAAALGAAPESKKQTRVFFWTNIDLGKCEIIQKYKITLVIKSEDYPSPRWRWVARISSAIEFDSLLPEAD